MIMIMLVLAPFDVTVRTRYLAYLHSSHPFLLGPLAAVAPSAQQPYWEYSQGQPKQMAQCNTWNYSKFQVRVKTSSSSRNFRVRVKQFSTVEPG